MDLVFSIDSVITAVGLAEHLIVMILAVMIAVFIMMIFIDPISNFINSHPEMKILALVFICAIGVLLVLDSAGIHTSIEVLDMHMEKLMVYFAMIFAVVLEFIQMAFNSRLNAWKKQLADEAIDAAVREAEGGEEPAKVGEQAAPAWMPPSRTPNGSTSGAGVGGRFRCSWRPWRPFADES